MGCIQKKDPIESYQHFHMENKVVNNHYDIHENPVQKKTNKESNSEAIKITSKLLIKEQDAERFKSSYKIMNKVGQGTFGSVFRVIHKNTDEIRAMKMIKRSIIELQDDEQKFLKEIQILIQLDHINIVKLYEYFIDKTNYYVILEFVCGGDLYDTMSNWQNYSEAKAGYIMRQLLSCVNYLHSHNIVHRDLKPENLMVERQSSKKKTNEADNEINIKLIDFGTCNFFDGKTPLTSIVGTPFYMAPEVLQNCYTEKCDIWSCGVILYTLLVGYEPFEAETTEEIFKKVTKGKFNMKGPEWDIISPSAKDLVQKMLTYDMNKRISAQDAFNHEWFVGLEEKNKEKIKTQDMNEVLKRLKNFNAKEKLQQATMAFIIHFCPAIEENRQLKKMFKELDKNGDGILSYKELKNGFELMYNSKAIGLINETINENELHRIIEEVDQDRNGYIDYEEFLRAVINQRNIMSEKNLKLAFNNFDDNGDGTLSIEEIKRVLGTTNNKYIQDIKKK